MRIVSKQVLVLAGGWIAYVLTLQYLLRPHTTVISHEYTRNLSHEVTLDPDYGTGTTQPGYIKKPTTVSNRSAPRELHVLYWTNKHSSMKTVVFSKCQVKRCHLTTKKEDLVSADVVFVNAWELANRGLPLPARRSADQRWVFYSRESPVHLHDRYNVNRLDDRYNITMTYMYGSDIHDPFTRYVPRTAPPKPYTSAQSSQNRTKLVAWMVSNCHTASLRENYVKELQKHIQVDLFGKCSKKPCPKDSCIDNIKSSYKFYLAAENSLCRDYVSEKIDWALENWMVPIVIGGSNYSQILPPHSFIDVTDFASPKELAEYLKLLDRNENLYNHYFDWRSSWKKEVGADASLWCRMCRYLHMTTTQKSRSTHPQLSSWFHPSQCMSAVEYYKGHAPSTVYM